MESQDRQVDYALRLAEERGVRFIRLWFTDVLGQLKSFAITPAELPTALSEGMTFDGSAIDGFSRTYESDVLAVPSARTFELLPWVDGAPSARMFCDIKTLSGEPFVGDSRNVLRRGLDHAKSLGYSFFVAPEMEYFLFASNDPEHPPVPLDSGGYFDLTTRDTASDIRSRTIEMLEQMGIPVEYSFHEDAPSQHEIDLRYTDALTMADTVMTFRLLVREIAVERGVYATFMPKPLADQQGSGMHTHMSLFKDDINAFHDPDDEYQLSGVAKAFIAGLLHHAREITAVTNQLVNSYRRLIAGHEAPSIATWGREHRSSLVRVPVVKTGKSSSTRVEYRSPDPACNPYLAYSVILAAGLRGIEQGYELPSESPRDVLTMDAAELKKNGIGQLPHSLDEALDEMESSELVRDALGDHIFEWFLVNKRAEWTQFHAQVTPFELRRYLPNL